MLVIMTNVKNPLIKSMEDNKNIDILVNNAGITRDAPSQNE